ncbi:MAG: ABC transporter permease [Spirochaetes bacterium]|uniref:ABC transporter permease n=1 Tax=Candidatus Aphodenecus pullistercoris TaxID=2840669 RepID=A0A9D9EB29_9SPIR|nr:ABC transporter permease [Candidatus Aphodenecus pullistercoris]
MSEKRTPFVRLAKRTDIDPKKAWLIRVASIVVALILGCIPMLFTGTNPIEAYSVIVQGSLLRPVYFRQTVKIAIPLLGCALAIAPCFKMRFWNIGAEGQITMGAMCATYFALYWVDKVPSAVLLVIMFLASLVGGGLWALIPAFFKAKWNTNETLFTLMMNYIAIGIVAWLQGGPWEGRKGSQLIPMFDDAARLPNLFGVHIGWIFVLVLVVLMHIYMNKTKQGYEIAVIGDSQNTARYAGMNVGAIIMRTMFISGAISGFVGFMTVSGANYTLYSGVADNVGFTAITVAWLSQLNAFAMIFISMLLAVISKGANTLQTRLQVPASISDIITGILLFAMLSCEFFINYRLIFRKKGEEVEA